MTAADVQSPAMSTPASPTAPPRTRRDKVVRRLVALTVMLGVVTLLALCAQFYWFFELFTHFVPWYAVCAAVLAAGLALARAWRWAGAAMALALWHGYAVIGYLAAGGAAAPADAPNKLTILHFNAYLHHDEPHRIASHIRRQRDVDVIVLLEATPRFAGMIAALKEDFPHQITHLIESPFGMAVLSRLPIVDGAIAQKPAGYEHIALTLKLAKREAPLALYAIHPPPPINGELAGDRDTALAHIATLAHDNPRATPIVVGDFNVTPWSPAFTRFARDSGLNPAHTPWRIDNTWPVTFGNANLGIAIDHTFAHPSLKLVSRVVGPDLGSDHLPVTVTFAY